MTQTVPISIRLTPEKASILDEMAKREEYSRNHLINMAIVSWFGFDAHKNLLTL